MLKTLKLDGAFVVDMDEYHHHSTGNMIKQKYFTLGILLTQSNFNSIAVISLYALRTNAAYVSAEFCDRVDGVSSKRACVFCLSLPHGHSKRSLVTFQTDDLYSKKSWLECLQSVCRNASLFVENVD